MRLIHTFIVVALSIPIWGAVEQRVAVQADLLPRGSFRYQGEIGPPSTAEPYAVTLTVSDGPSGVTVTAAAQLPGGPASEEVTLDQSTLVVRRRQIRMGDLAFDLRFTPDGVEGLSIRGGNVRTIAFPIGAELFADGGGAFAVLGALPLRDGLHHEFHNLDLSKRTTSKHHAFVTGPETVVVKAGVFRAFRIELTTEPAAASRTVHVWIDADARVLLKVASDASRYELNSRS